MTRWESILEYVRAAAASAAGMGSAETNAVDPLGQGTVFPAANVREGNSDINLDLSSLGMDEWERELHIDVVTLGGDLEALRAKINAAVLADLTLGGLADMVLFRGVEKDVKFDPSSGAQAMTITYQVSYELPTGSE